MVRIGCAVLPGSDAAVFIVREADKILAATSDCNSLYVLQDPREGARIAIAEAARNLTCSGARLLAVTDNLNFANPHNPELFWQLRESVEGLAEGCREFGTPVTGGNVSLYNQSPAGRSIPRRQSAWSASLTTRSTSPRRHSSPRRRHHPRRPRARCWCGCDALVAECVRGALAARRTRRRGVAGTICGGGAAASSDLSLGASHYMKVVHGQKAGRTPRLSFDLEKRVQVAVLGSSATAS